MKEKKQEEKIIVIDEGVDADDMASPRGGCCRGTLFRIF
jgi:hypothetical protein